MNSTIIGCGVEFPREESRCRLEHRNIFTEPLVLGLQPLDLGELSAGVALAFTGIDIGLAHPTPQRFRADASWRATATMACALDGYSLRCSHEPDGALTERGIDFLWHGAILSTRKDAAPNPRRFNLSFHCTAVRNESPVPHHQSHCRGHRYIPGPVVFSDLRLMAYPVLGDHFGAVHQCRVPDAA